jgi:hypothetical protein
MYLVERLGRRVLLLTSVVGVIISLCCLGGAFFLINHDSAKAMRDPLLPETISGVGDVKDIDRCLTYENCDYCVTDESCGFCAFPEKSAGGYCFPKDPNNPANNASVGQCSSTNGSDQYHTVDNITYEWADTYCHTKYTILPIILMVVYLCCFSIGRYFSNW